MITVVGLGAGGHAGVMLDILKHQRTYKPIGLLEADPEKAHPYYWGAFAQFGAVHPLRNSYRSKPWQLKKV